MGVRRTKNQISKDNYNKEVDSYKWYVVNVAEKKAISGFEHKADATDLLLDYGNDKNYKVVAKSTLKRIGVNIPNENWKYQPAKLMAPAKQITKIQLINHLNTLSNDKLGNDYAYIMSTDLDRSLWWANDKEYRPIIIERLASEILTVRNKKNIENLLLEVGYKNKSINKSKPMATAKKATPAQLAARKRFAEMAKNGTLAKKRAAADKKGLNAPAKRKTITAKKLCSKVIRREGLKIDGTLKKGYHYTPGGKVVKAAPKKKVAAKKPTVKAPARKKFLGIF
jgi:hypothetical protein